MQDLQNARYDIGDFSSILHTPDVLRLTYHSSNLPSPGTIRTNFSRLVDPDVDALLVEAAGLPNGDERDELYSQLQEDVIENVWAIPIYVPTRIIATAPEVQGVVAGVEGYPLLHYANLANG
jgi:peptide/nickel transport system substrate-binding protein